MNAKTYLSQIKVLEHRIESRTAILADLKAMAEKTGFEIKDVVVCQSLNEHAMEDIVIKIADMKDRISRDFSRLLELKTEIADQIQAIPDPRMQQVLELYYIQHKPWEDIADEMGCTESNVYKLHALALREIQVPDFVRDSDKFQ